MKKALLIFLSAFMIMGCTKITGTLSIVPNPTSVAYTGKGIRLVDDLDVKCSKDLSPIRQLLLDQVKKDGLTGFPAIELKLDSSLSDEEYIFDASTSKVVIRGGSQAGVWWGVQTLLQVLHQCCDGIPGVIIRDKPQFAYRGASFDCCRHFFSVDEVKQFINMMALHKINTLHWHLTDDQGWRIEIKKYPRLTEVGSNRSETLVGHFGSTEYDGTPYGGYYTQDEMRDVVSYAAARFITVIPEVEMPGHAVAALASYPYLGCTGGPYSVYRTWGITSDVFCPGKDSTINFLKNVLDEVCEIFPSEYIHIGGDEAPRTRWHECPACQARMAELGLTREAQLQSYLVNTIEKYLNDKGRKIIGWDEILEGGVSKSATVMSWRGAKGGIEAAKLGNDVIMTPNSHFYLDYYQTADPEANGEPLAIGGHLPLSKCYSFQPFDQLDEEQKAHIIGIQANTWTEYIASFDHVQHMVLPRLAALAEVAWSCDNRTTYEDFVQRISKCLLPIYLARGYNYADYAFKNPPLE